jgi:hypothetical protein
MLTARLNGEVGDVPADRAGALPPAKASLARALAAVNRAQEELEIEVFPTRLVIPAKAGIQGGSVRRLILWTPRFREGDNNRSNRIDAFRVRL